jgi:ABC-type antimicrobial peptide transport system permease subunit
MALAGLVIGIAAARASAVGLRRLLWGVTIDDPTTFAIAAAVMAVVALAATLGPALRIARLDPVTALRAKE